MLSRLFQNMGLSGYLDAIVKHYTIPHLIIILQSVILINPTIKLQAVTMLTSHANLRKKGYQ